MHRRPSLTLTVLSTLLLLLTTTSLVACAETSAPPRATYAPPFCPNPARIPRTVAPAEKVTLPILMYHHITHLQPNATPTWRTLTVTPEAFEAQVKWLADHGYHTIYFTDLVAYFRDGVPLPEKPIILTFDDGWTDDYTIAYPILRRHCMVRNIFSAGRLGESLQRLEGDDMADDRGDEPGRHGVRQPHHQPLPA